MRLPFNLTGPELEREARVTFSYTSPELHQNIEVSIDGDDTSVETLLDTFQRFLNALGISTPENVMLSFVEFTDENDDDNEGNTNSEE
jgi:hypothetical protein